MPVFTQLCFISAAKETSAGTRTSAFRVPSRRRVSGHSREWPSESAPSRGLSSPRLRVAAGVSQAQPPPRRLHLGPRVPAQSRSGHRTPTGAGARGSGTTYPLLLALSHPLLLSRRPGEALPAQPAAWRAAEGPRAGRAPGARATATCAGEAGRGVRGRAGAARRAGPSSPLPPPEAPLPPGARRFLVLGDFLSAPARTRASSRPPPRPRAEPSRTHPGARAGRGRAPRVGLRGAWPEGEGAGGSPPLSLAQKARHRGLHSQRGAPPAMGALSRGLRPGAAQALGGTPSPRVVAQVNTRFVYAQSPTQDC